MMKFQMYGVQIVCKNPSISIKKVIIQRLVITGNGHLKILFQIWDNQTPSELCLMS